MANTESEEIVQLFHDSLERCGPAKQFLGRFYEIFVASSPQVAEKFADTNLALQTRALKTSFYMAMLASDQKTDAADYLERIATHHNHQHLDIKPQFYDLWMDSMVAAVKEYDPMYDEQVELVWRQFMAPAIEYMKSKY